MTDSLFKSALLLTVLCAVMWKAHPFGLVLIGIGAVALEAWKMGREERWYPRLRAMAGLYDEDARSCAGCQQLIFDDFEHDFCDTPADVYSELEQEHRRKE